MVLHLHHLFNLLLDQPFGVDVLEGTGWVEKQGVSGVVRAARAEGAAPATKPQPAASYAKDGIFSQWGRPPPALTPSQAPLPSPIRQVRPRCLS